MASDCLLDLRFAETATVCKRRGKDCKISTRKVAAQCRESAKDGRNGKIREGEKWWSWLNSTDEGRV